MGTTLKSATTLIIRVVVLLDYISNHSTMYSITVLCVGNLVSVYK